MRVFVMPSLADQLLVSLAVFKTDAEVKAVALEISAELSRIVNYGKTKDQKESIPKDKLIAQLYQKIINKLNDPKMNVVEEKINFSDLLYQVIIYLASLQPRNFVEVITQDKKEEIKPDCLFYTLDGYFWDIRSLCQLMYYAKDIKNPATNVLLTPRDITAIKIKASELNIKIIPKDEKSGPSDLTPLDSMAIESLLDGWLASDAAPAIAALRRNPARSALRVQPLIRRSGVSVSFRDRYEIASRLGAANGRAFAGRRDGFGYRPILGRVSFSLATGSSGQSFFGREWPVEHYQRIIYETLHRANLLNDDTRALVNRDTSFISQLNIGVQNLSIAHLLTQENLSIVVAAGVNAKHCAVLLGILNANNLLNEASRTYILENKANLGTILNGMQSLDRESLVTDENFLTLLQAPYNASLYGIILSRLHKADILNQENRDLIIDNLQCVETLGLRIQSIQDLNQAKFTALVEEAVRDRVVVPRY
jgi:hypothetical protein